MRADSSVEPRSRGRPDSRAEHQFRSRLDIELMGGPRVQFEGETRQTFAGIARAMVARGTWRRTLGGRHPSPVGVEVQAVQRDARVFHTEPPRSFVPENKQQAIIGPTGRASGR